MYNKTLISHFLYYLSQKTDISRNILKQWDVISGICVIRVLIWCSQVLVIITIVMGLSGN